MEEKYLIHRRGSDAHSDHLPASVTNAPVYQEEQQSERHRIGEERTMGGFFTLKLHRRSCCLQHSPRTKSRH